LSGRGLCDELITRPEESYRLCCVVVCDLETSRIGAPYIYDIRSLRVKNIWNFTLSCSCGFMSQMRNGKGVQSKVCLSAYKPAIRLCRNSVDRVPRFICLVGKLMYILNFKLPPFETPTVRTRYELGWNEGKGV